MTFKKALLSLGLSSFIAVQAVAVPWCHRGTIVEVADVTWSGATATAMASSIPVPVSVADPERYQIFHATNDYCESYAGGGGPIWWNNVPGVGTVNTIPYAPYILTNTVNNYDLSMGVSFTCEKCYAIAPYEAIKDFKELAPLPGTEGKVRYERKVEDR